MENYQSDPNSVPESWRMYFESLEAAERADADGSLVLDEKSFNQPTIVLGGGINKQRSNSSPVSAHGVVIF